MRGMIVKEGEWPHRRKTSCCHRRTRAGDSLILIDYRIHGALKDTVFVHKSCADILSDSLPADAADPRYAFKQLRAGMLAGEAFPVVVRPPTPRGVRAVLVEDLEEQAG